MMMKVALFIAFCSVCVWGLPTSEKAADRCNTNNCKIEDDCRCSSGNNPIADKDNPAPQLIAITVSESVVQTLYDDYLAPLFFDRKNPDGNPIGLTFYVPHEYTDYTLVQDLYVRGYEIGDHSITKNGSQEYWRQATLEDLEEEFGGQKTIISTFAKIPAEDIVGVRTPQLQLEGDVSIDAYVNSEFKYDNSWPTMSTELFLPYTLDYASTQRCTVTMKCPTESHPHFWIAPITNIKGANDIECNSLATCLVEGTADEISTWLLDQVALVKNDTRAPLTLRLDSYWFSFTKNSYEGFTKFLEEVGTQDDVFLVSVQDVVDWIENPVPATAYATSVHDDRTKDCTAVSCALTNIDGELRYMKSCVPCPEVYPWKGNPLGEA
jgi:hypothetical protein